MTPTITESGGILHTKLDRPRLGPGMVQRRRLLDRLEDALERPLILVSAPAGYGKTTMVNLWLEASPRRYAWLSLDEHDSNLSGFASYLVAALRTAFPEAGSSLSALLAAPSTPQPEVLADLFLKDLEELEGSLILVLEDYYLVRNVNVHAFLARVVARLPANLHMVLISRIDPPIGLARLRGRGQLAEFRAGDLRFTRDEIAELVQGLRGEAGDDEVIKVLEQRTEGWAVGLQLVGMALRESEDPVDFARRFALSSHRTVMDYLLSEVLEELGEEQFALILRASILDRFCAPLCDALVEGTGLQGRSQSLIDLAWQTNLFLVALDAEGVWYRYHHLFGDLLRQQLHRLSSRETIAGLHRRASAWFEENHLVDEAITHALQAGDMDRAARLVESNMNIALNEEEWRLLGRWLGLLSEAMLQRPALLIAQAYLAFFNFNHGSIEGLLDACLAGLAANTAGYSPQELVQLRGHVHQLRANMFLNRSPEQRLRDAELALRLLAPEARFARSHAELFYGNTLHQAGRTAEGMAYLSTRLRQQTGQPDVRTFRLMLGILSLHYAEADLASMHSTAQTLLQMAQASERVMTAGWALFVLGWVHYQRGEFDLAQGFFAQGIDTRYAIQARAAVDCHVGLALIQRAQGCSEAALATAAALREYLVELGLVNTMAAADALDLCLALNSGEYESSVRPGQVPVQLTAEPEAQLAADLMVPPVLVAIRAHLARGTRQSLATAWQLLQQCRSYAEGVNLRRRLIEIGALQALLHRARGEEEAALSALRESILLAEPGGALRLIADAGPGLRPYLHQLQEQGVAPAYVTRLLAACVYDEGAMVPAAPGAALALSQVAAAPGDRRDMVEDLTMREIEVVQLLAQGLTNKEIATALTVSPNTVKKHTINLYRKLQVPNRQRAVRVARALGYLPQER